MSCSAAAGEEVAEEVCKAMGVMSVVSKEKELGEKRIWIFFEEMDLY